MVIFEPYWMIGDRHSGLMLTMLLVGYRQVTSNHSALCFQEKDDRCRLIAERFVFGLAFGDHPGRPAKRWRKVPDLRSSTVPTAFEPALMIAATTSSLARWASSSVVSKMTVPPFTA